MKNTSDTNDRIMVAMSGGIDSSVAAYLCREKVGSLNTAGAIMALFEDVKADNDAKKVADRLGIPFFIFDLQHEFRSEVVEPFITTYEVGRTPNPCVDCNRNLKFGLFYDKLKELGYNKIATGHYAKIEYDEISRRYLLKKAADPIKDQSYFLYTLSQEQLSRTIFPLCDMTKDQVRELASAQNFETAYKEESQDICFVPNSGYSKFIEEYRGGSYPEGDFTDLEGNVLGTHKGIIRYTTGQRKGLGLALPEPMYVYDKCIEDNTVILCKNDELYSNTAILINSNLITMDEIQDPIHVKAKVRYSQPEQPATVTQLDSKILKVVFDKPQRAITKGQSLVMYDGDTVVGGGIVNEVP